MNKRRRYKAKRRRAGRRWQYANGSTLRFGTDSGDVYTSSIEWGQWKDRVLRSMRP